MEGGSVRLLRRLFKSRQRNQTAVKLRSIGFQDNTMKIVAEHPSVAIIAQEMTDFFIRTGCTNHFEMGMYDERIGMFKLVMQRDGAWTPEDVKAIMRAALEQIADERSTVDGRVIAQNVLRRLGYAAKGRDNEG